VWHDGALGFLGSTLSQALNSPQGAQADLANYQGDTIGIDVSSSGNVDLGLHFDVGLGEVNASVPVALSLSLPDQLPAGGTFTMGSSWALADGAQIWGKSPQLSATLNFDFSNMSMGGVPHAIQGILEAVPFRSTPQDHPLPPLRFDLPARRFVGVPFRDVYPDGLPPERQHCWLFDCSLNHTVGEVWDGAATALNGTHASDIVGDNQRMPDWATANANPTYFTESDYPNLIFTQSLQTRAFHQAVDPASLVDWLVGDSWNISPSGLWWADFTFQFQGGEARLRYDLWSSQFFFDFDVYEAFYLNVDGVTVTLTLEDGTVIPDLPVGQDASIRLPANVDQNGDGRVDITFDYHIRTSFTHFLVDIPLLDYQGRTLGLKYGVYRHEYDARGNVIGETPLSTGGWGPVSNSEYDIGKPQDRTDTWALPGFQTVTAHGRFQLSH
jgi:hypothetical protein